MLQQLLAFFNSSAGGALIAVIGSIVGFFISFLTQSWLERQKFTRNLKMKSWEAKVERLRQFSEDLELWLYLVRLESRNLQRGEHIERFQSTGNTARAVEIQDVTKKLIRSKTHLMQFPNIFNKYREVVELIEWTESAPPYLESRDMASIQSLIKAIQEELLQEISTF